MTGGGTEANGSAAGGLPALPTPPAGELAGRKILVTSGGELGARLAAGIRELDGEAIVAPVVRAAPPADATPLNRAVADWKRGGYDWMLVTSAAGAHALASRAGEADGTGVDPGSPGAIGAVGPATADALAAAGFPVALVPPTDFSARGLADAFLAHVGSGRADALRILLPLSEIAGTELESALAAAGHRPERVTAYRTIATPRDRAVEQSVLAGEVDAILVTSGSGAREVSERFRGLPERVRAVAIGPPTAAALNAVGIRVAAVTESHTAAGLLEALVTALQTTPDSPGSTIHTDEPHPTRKDTEHDSHGTPAPTSHESGDAQARS